MSPAENRPTEFDGEPTRNAPVTPRGGRGDGGGRPIDPESPTIDQSFSPALMSTGWLAPGDVLGPYTVTRVIGEGGFGVVYEAEQEEPIRRTVAVKVLKPGMETREIVLRFEGERQALALLDHPGIAKILDAGVTPGGRPYFAMELVRGVPITRFCDEASMDIQARVRLMIEVCEAVQHAHQRGIIHRDIKPSNILVHDASERTGTFDEARTRSTARARIIDFGIAKATAPGVNRAETLVGHFLGTPEYMSPEQAGSAGVDADVRSDVYSLGVTLYELLTGRLPIETPVHGDALDMLRRLRDEEPVRASARYADQGSPVVAANASRRGGRPGLLAKQLRGDLDWILLKSLEKDRERRYVSARDFGQDLERSLSGLPVLAGPPGTLYRAGKFARRHRLALTAAGAVMLALVCGLALASYGLVQARDQRDIAILERENSDRAAIAARQAKEEADRQAQAATVAKGEALREAETAQAVRTFLQEMIASGDPEKGATADMTMRRALDQAAARLDAGSLRDQARVEAEVRQTLSDAYLSMGLMSDAEKQIRRTLDLRRQAEGDTSMAYAIALNSLAYLLDDLGRYEEAEKCYRDVVAAFEQWRATEPFNLATAKNNLATLLRRTGRLQEAEAQFRGAIELMKARPGVEHPTLGQTMGNLALCLRGQRKYKEAEELNRQALEIIRRTDGESPSLARALLNLATVLQDRREYEKAEPLFKEALALQRRFFTPPHREIATALNNLGILYVDWGRPAEAIGFLRESLRDCEKSMGPEHPETIFAKMNVGLCLNSLGELDEAESILLDAAAQARTVLGMKSTTTGRILFGLGDLETERGQIERAERSLRDSIDAFQQVSGPESLQATGSMIVLSDALVRKGDWKAALEWAERALALRRTLLETGDWQIAQAESAVGSALAASGRSDEGVPLMERGARILAEERGVAPAAIRRGFQRLLWHYQRAGDAARAAEYEKLAAAVGERAKEPRSFTDAPAR